MSRVALIGENSIGYIDALLEIWNAGDCAVLLDWRIPFSVMLEMMSEAGVQKCYIENDLFSKIKEKEDFSNHLECILFDKGNDISKPLPDSIYKKFHKKRSDPSKAAWIRPFYV